MNLERLARFSTAKTLPAGEVVIKEGDTAPYSMYVLLKGVVCVYKNHGTPESVHIATLKPTNFFGEMSLFLKQPRCATVVVTEPTMLLEITQKNLLEVMKEDQDLSLAVMQAMCEREQS